MGREDEKNVRLGRVMEGSERGTEGGKAVMREGAGSDERRS